jgi:hypothetical protein
MKGLIIKEPWIDKILSGEKTWEIRGSNTKRRGTISLIQSGTGMIFGTVDLVDTIRVGFKEFRDGRDKHQIWSVGLPSYRQNWAWVLENPVRHPEPIPYKHPQGAVIWVNLGEGVIQ